MDLPLAAWVGPAKVWFPILIVSFVFLISICRMVHRQWSEHEQLSYPIAEFANSLMKNDLGRSMSDVFYNRQFWIAFGIVFFIHMVNGGSLYLPNWIKIPTESGPWLESGGASSPIFITPPADYLVSVPRHDLSDGYCVRLFPA